MRQTIASRSLRQQLHSGLVILRIGTIRLTRAGASEIA
jgi:hypothetical protein